MRQVDRHHLHEAGERTVLREGRAGGREAGPVLFEDEAVGADDDRLVLDAHDRDQVDALPHELHAVRLEAEWDRAEHDGDGGVTGVDDEQAAGVGGRAGIWGLLPDLRRCGDDRGDDVLAHEADAGRLAAGQDDGERRGVRGIADVDETDPPAGGIAEREGTTIGTGRDDLSDAADDAVGGERAEEADVAGPLGHGGRCERHEREGRGRDEVEVHGVLGGGGAQRVALAKDCAHLRGRAMSRA